jgi:hypothetical protein
MACSVYSSGPYDCHLGDYVELSKDDAIRYCDPSQSLKWVQKFDQDKIGCRFKSAAVKVYRWKDKDGVPYASDKLPPKECRTTECEAIFQAVRDESKSRAILKEFIVDGSPVNDPVTVQVYKKKRSNHYSPPKGTDGSVECDIEFVSGFSQKIVTYREQGITYAINGQARSRATRNGWTDGKLVFSPEQMQNLLQEGLRTCP